jgi:hypothetical protein
MAREYSTHEINAKFCSEDLKERATLGELGRDGTNILQWILKLRDARTETGFRWFR